MGQGVDMVLDLAQWFRMCLFEKKKKRMCLFEMAIKA